MGNVPTLRSALDGSAVTCSGVIGEFLFKCSSVDVKRDLRNVKEKSRDDGALEENER